MIFGGHIVLMNTFTGLAVGDVAMVQATTLMKKNNIMSLKALNFMHSPILECVLKMFFILFKFIMKLYYALMNGLRKVSKNLKKCLSDTDQENMQLIKPSAQMVRELM